VLIFRTSCIYVSKDVRISGYFSKPERGGKQKSLGNTALRDNKIQVRETTIKQTHEPK